jgi:hypothetical protein
LVLGPFSGQLEATTTSNQARRDGCRWRDDARALECRRRGDEDGAPACGARGAQQSENEILAIEGFAQRAWHPTTRRASSSCGASEIREFISASPSEVGAAPRPGRDRGRGARAQTVSGPIGSRPQALARLREVAEFFRQTEPHSPLPHLIDRAVRWAGMSFEELLVDVMKNNDVLTPVWNTLGIKAPPPESGV